MPEPVPIRASTQEALPIEDIRDDLVILKNGSAALVLRVNAINFSLLSQREQDAIIYAYAGLLNSLNFSIQILIRSQKKDITNYLQLLDKAKNKQSNEMLQELVTDYQNFVKETVTKREILDKSFYLIIPFSSLELGAGHVASDLFSKINPLAKKDKKTINYDKVVEKAKTALIPKRDHLLRLLGRIGLVAKQLNTNELIRLFFKIYNPESQGIENTLNKSYLDPVIQNIDNND